MDHDTKEKINFLKKKEFHKMLQFIDADQLLEEYGGTLKLPERIWPPVDSYSPEARNSINPILTPENPGTKYEYEPGINESKTLKYSIPKSEEVQIEDFETGALIPSEPLHKSKIPSYNMAPLRLGGSYLHPIDEKLDNSHMSDNSQREIAVKHKGDGLEVKNGHNQSFTTLDQTKSKQSMNLGGTDSLDQKGVGLTGPIKQPVKKCQCTVI